MGSNLRIQCFKGYLTSSNAKDLIQKQIGHLTSGFFSMPTLLHLNVIQSLSGSISNDDVDDDDDVNDDFDDNTAGSWIFVYSNCWTSSLIEQE